MTALKPYPKYKDSGIEWIGEVPEDWEIVKYKRALIVKNGHGFPEKYQGNKKGDYPFLKVSDISFDGKYVKTAANYIDKEIIKEEKWNIISIDSILTAKIGEALKKNHRKINTKDCLIDNNMMALKPLSNVKLNYIYYLLNIVDFDWYTNPGAVPSMNNQQFREDFFATPPMTEQNKIMNFLDEKTEEIDTLISDKERLIKLLEEKRQAVITETVTKGLDPNVKMKDSGIEWIGEIPEHWETVKLKFIGDATMGLLYSPTEITYKGQGKLVLRASNIQSSAIDMEREDNVYVNKEIPKNLITQVDDILVCARSGSRDLIGKSALIDDYSAGNSFGAFTTVFRSGYNDFISYVFRSGLFQSQIGTYLTSTINQLTMSNLRNLEIVFPSRKEQKSLVFFLKEYDGNINNSIKEIEKQISKLKEYRESLIYEAVTGKIDVRNYEEHLTSENVYEQVAETRASYEEID